MKPPVNQLVEGLELTIKKLYRELGYSVEACNHNGNFAIDDKGNLCRQCFGLSWKVEVTPSEESEEPSKLDQLTLVVNQLSLRMENLEGRLLNELAEYKYQALSPEEKAAEEARLNSLEDPEVEVETDSTKEN